VFMPSRSIFMAASSCSVASKALDLGIFASNWKVRSTAAVYRRQRPPPRHTNREQHRSFTTGGDDPWQPCCFARSMSELCRRRRRPRQEDVTAANAAIDKHPAAARRVRRVGFYERTQPPSHASPIRRRRSEKGTAGEKNLVARSTGSGTNLSDPGVESDRNSPYDRNTLYESGIWLTR
jgi:hypothetical protein